VESVNKNYQVIISDEATQMLLYHVRFIVRSALDYSEVSISKIITYSPCK